MVDGNNVLEVYRYTSEAVARARRGEGPTLLECKTYRWEGHVVGEQAFITGSYRSEEEVARWKARCPIIELEKTVLESSMIKREELDRIAKQAHDEVEAAVEFARQSPLPEPAEARRTLDLSEKIENRKEK